VINRTSVDAYLQDGCGRCEHYTTPACKVLRWTDALVHLRALLLAEGLDEEMKWGSPCYTVGGKNVLMLISLKESCGISFFKGAALADDAGLLESAGPNSQLGKLVRFRSIDEVRARHEGVVGLVRQAVALERAGTKVARPAAALTVPGELEACLAADPALRAAFDALTPGRRRSHILHVSGAKGTETRARRAEKCAEDIRSGKGFNER
jgi:uncharacterized protein YdeI (YjbR/CyaY-like superfamily)